jgi:uncharacterized membrane-anchored protein YjiN (DUF445 family)
VLVLKKHINKKLIISLLVATLLIGGGKAFASSGIFNDLINLIRDRFTTATDYFIQDTDQKNSQFLTEKTKDLKEHIDSTSSQTITDIEAHKNSEIARAEDEVEAYVNEFKNQMDDFVGEEKSKLQQKISEKIDKDVEKFKKDLKKDMDKYLKDNFLNATSYQ